MFSKLEFHRQVLVFITVMDSCVLGNHIPHRPVTKYNLAGFAKHEKYPVLFSLSVVGETIPSVRVLFIPSINPWVGFSALSTLH